MIFTVFAGSCEDMFRAAKKLRCTRSQLRSKKARSAILFQFSYSIYVSVLLKVYLVTHSHIFVHFYNGSKHSAEVLSSTPKCERTVMCLREKIHIRSALLRCTVVLLAMSLILVNQQYILYMVFWNRNSHKQGYVFIHWKNVVTGGSQDSNTILQYSLNQCTRNFIEDTYRE